MAGPKADKLTKERRVEAVYRLILDGWTRDQIFANTREWKVTDSQVRRYIREARERFEEGSALTRAELLAEHIAARRQMRREAKTVKDKLNILKDEAALLGLYPAKAVELSGKDGGPLAVEHTHHLAEVSDDDLRRNLAAFGRAALAASGRAPIPDDSGGATGDDSESESQ